MKEKEEELKCGSLPTADIVGAVGKTVKKKEKTDENSGHYVIASSRLPERRPLDAARSHQKLDSSDIK